MSLSIRVAACAVAVVALSCGGAAKTEAPRAAAPARPQAVRHLAQGVAAAREADGRARAIALFERAVSTDGELWEARYDLGVLYAQAGDLARAERELAKASTLAPNAEDVAVALAEVRRRRQDRQGAVAALETFVTRHPEAIGASILLIAALRDAGHLDRSIDLAHRVLLRRPRDPQALSELALGHLERGEIDTAELLAKEAAKGAAPSAVTERTAGLIALRRGDDALAFRHFTRATELDPNDTTAQLNIGTVLIQAGVYDRAAGHFTAVLQSEPDNVPAAIGLAAARRGQARRGDQSALSQAESLLRGVLQRDPQNLAATFNLAVLYADSMKRPDDASPLFERFLGAAPKDHPARADAEKWLLAQKR